MPAPSQIPLNSPSDFWRKHLYIPLAVFILIASTIELAGIDRLLADYFYALEGGRWALKDAWITSTIIHKLGRNLSLLILLVVIIALIQSFFFGKYLSNRRRQFIYLIIAAGGASGLVSLIKAVSHVSCAWDFSRYGGKTEYASVFTEMFHLSGGDCFPAGHASGGYAWIAFYFLGLHLRSSWRWWGLAIPCLVGIIFGFSQQLRGAHFISHDVWTLAICWFFSLTIYRMMLVNKSA